MTRYRPRTLKHERKPAYPRVSVPSKAKLDRWQVRFRCARDARLGFLGARARETEGLTATSRKMTTRTVTRENREANGD